MIVDSHVHVVGPESRYPLQPSGIGNEWFRDAPVDVEQFSALMDEAGVDRAVLVQAMGAYGFDNDYVLDAAASNPERFRSVVIVDGARDPDAAAKALRTLAAERGAHGVRLFALAEGWFATDEAEVIWRAAAELGLTVVVTILANQLAALDRALLRFPDVPVALDHCGFADFGDAPDFPHATPLLALAGHAHLSLKVSSHVLQQVADPADVVDRLAATFGADRLLWGSDFPQTHDRPYHELLDLGRAGCRRLARHEQAAFLGGNALRAMFDLPVS